MDAVGRWAGAVRRALWWALVALAVVLVVTGVHLMVDYQPQPSQAWPALGAADRSPTFADRSRQVHRAATVAAIVVGVLLAGATLVDTVRRRPLSGSDGRATPGLGAAALAGGGLLALLIVATASGLLLPWDQLALRQVTVGEDWRGYRWIFGDEVRFVLVDGAEVAPSTMRTWVLVHGAAAVAALGVLAVLRHPWPRSS